MNLLGWDAALSIGHRTIDLQHRELLALTAAIAAQARAGRVVETRDLFLRLADDYERHTADEEALMKALGYPHLEEHRLEHQRLLRRLQALLEPGIAGSADNCAAVMDCVRSMIVMHILNDDLDLRETTTQRVVA